MSCRERYKIITPQVGDDGDVQLVVDKTATQLKCLLEQLVNLVKQDDHVIQSHGDVAKVKQVSKGVVIGVSDNVDMYTYRMDHVIAMDY